MTKFEILFIRFLKDNDCFHQYFINLNEQKGSVDLYKTMIENENDYIIDFSFCWSKTKEGHEFWSKLHNDFLWKTHHFW